MSRIEYSFAALPLEDVCSRFRDEERFIVYCRECERWNRCWACPPLTVEPGEYLRPYRYATFVAAKIVFDNAELERADSPETVRAAAWSELKRVKAKLFEVLLQCESSVPGSIQLGSGGCHLCSVCARISGKPCRHPEKLRFSLDSFGFDLTMICEELLGIKLLWSDGTRLPDYYTLVHALLSCEPVLDTVRSIVGQAPVPSRPG